MALQVDIQGRVLIANLNGELDHYHAERLRTQIDSAFDNSPCRHLVLNMEGVNFMDSSGIGMIIGRYKNTEKRGGQLALSSMNETISRLFDISGLAKIVMRSETTGDALRVLGGGIND